MKATNEYLKDRYNEERLRFDHFENKSAKLLTFISAVIAALIAIAGVNTGVIFHPTHPVLWIARVSFLLGAFSICCAWGHTLLSLRVGDVPVMPMSTATAEWLSKVDEKHQLEHIFNCYRDTLPKLTEVINQKSSALQLAYSELVFSAWMLGVTSFLYIVMELAK